MRQVLCWMSLLLTAAVSAAPTYTVRDFVDDVKFSVPRISPGGQYIALTVPDGDTTRLAIIDLDTRKYTHTVSFGGGVHVDTFAWTSPKRIVFNTVRKLGWLAQKVYTCDLYAINFDGTGKEQLWSAAELGSCPFVLDSMRQDDDNIIVGAYGGGSITNPPPPQVFKLNTTTKRRTLLSFSPATNGEMIVDNGGEPRVAVGFDEKSGESVLYYRDKGALKWDDLSTIVRADDRARIVGFTPDDRALYLIAGQANGGPDALWILDPKTKQRTLVQANKSADVMGFVWDDDKIVGVDFEPVYPERVLLDKQSQVARFVASIEQGFPDEMVICCSLSTDRSRGIVTTYSDRNPGDLYLLDATAMKLTRLFSRKPQLDPKLLPEREPVAFKARDGMQIPAYLTRPLGRPKNGPLVVLPHGGPHGPRDGWSYDTEAALLAYHGYAVLQVNYRGSGGYGLAFEQAGYRKWGTAMQDDLTDATQWAIKQGIADPARICIYGASYGGYAALMGVVKEPDLYRCAVGYAGVYDLRLMKSVGDVSRTHSGTRYLSRVLGRDKAELAARSPVAGVDRIKAALFLAHGERDDRAPFEHFTALRTALDKAGKRYESMTKPDEGHGFALVENRVEFYSRLLRFLHANIGGADTKLPAPDNKAPDSKTAATP